MDFVRIARGARFGLLAALLLPVVGSGDRVPRRESPPIPLPALADTAGQHPLPAGLAPVLATALAADQTNAYAVTSLGDRQDAFHATNPAQHLTTAFHADGLAVTGDPAGDASSATWRMHLAAIGDGANLLPVAAAPPTLNGTRVEYRRGNVTEWYVNSPLGVEQGFTLATPPVGARTGNLVLAVNVTGAVTADDGVGGITLALPDGGQARYGQLTATDATGRALSARLLADGGEIHIVVDDRGAVYPVVVDPLLQQGSKLTGSGESGTGAFGSAVALSGDGITALVGAFYDNDEVGAPFVFTRSGEVWSQQGSKLTGSGEVGEGRFGSAMALSSDGTTALVGAPGDNGEFDVGAAFVFTRSGGVWSQQGNKLTGSDESGTGEFGSAVALSGDGATALVGAFYDNLIVGAAFVFTRSGGVWTQQGNKLTGSGETGSGQFGSAVALSSDGATALIGAPYDNRDGGAAFVFTRSGTTWGQQQELTSSGEVGEGGKFGSAVTLSSDGTTALVGASYDSHEIGVAFVFTRSSGAWTQEGNKLTGSDEVGRGVFGYAVALSGDATTALVGAPGDNGLAGAAFTFTPAAPSPLAASPPSPLPTR